MRCTAMVRDKKTGKLRRCKNSANCAVHKRRKVPKRTKRSGIAVKLDPKLWELAKEQACSQGGLCKHSARKMQYATRLYKKRGGRYLGPKSKHNKLAQWGKQNWTTYSGKKSESKRRYLPAAAWDALTPEEIRQTNRAKRRGYERGQQFVKQPRNIAKKTRPFRKVRFN